MGLLFSLLSGVFLGLFQALNGRAREALAVRTGTAVLLIVSTVILSVALLLEGGAPGILSVPFPALLLFGAAGLIHFSLGWSLLSVSQNLVGAGRTGVLVGSTPIWAAILGFTLLQERLSLTATLGILLVVGGVVVVSSERIPPE